MLSLKLVFFLFLASVFCCYLRPQPHHRAADDRGLPAVHAHGDDIRSIIHRIKSAEILHRLHAKLSERVRTVNTQRALGTCINMRTCTIHLPSLCARRSQSQDPAAVETPERPLPLQQQQQQQARIKRRLVNVYVSFCFTCYFCLLLR